MSRYLFAMLLLLAGPGRAGDDAESARTWLEKSHQAAGGSAWDEVRTSRARFDLQLPGLAGTAEASTDVVTGRYVNDATLGPYRFVNGLDKDLPWSKDTSGQVQVEDGDSAREAAVSERYRRMLAYWYPERWPAAYADLGPVTEHDRALRRIRVVPEGGRAFELWIDEQTALIERIVENDGIRDETIHLYDYRDVDGRVLPHQTRYSTGDPKYDQFTALTSIEFDVELDQIIFAVPGPPPPDYRFADGRTQTTVPFRLLNNHTYVEVMLNGQGPFNVILDTGGVNVITPAVAARLGVDTQGRMEIRGAGEETQDMALAHLESVTIGEVTVENQMFIVIDFDELSRAEGVTVDGLIGYEMFKRFVVRLNYGDSTLTLHERGGFRYQGGGTPIEFEFDGHTPVVAGAIDGIEGKLTFDTGSRNHVSLHAPFVEQHGLLERHPEGIEGIDGWGVGGPARGRVLRGTSLRIGDEILIHEPIMSLSLQKTGAMTDRYQIANLGAGILSRFNLVFDYAEQTVYFERHAGTDRRDIYDRSGVWLNHAGDGFEVMGLIADGPAEAAGLEVGDRITAVDGTPTAALALPELRAQWRDRPPGTGVELEFVRDGASQRTRMTLRDLIPPPESITGGGE